MQTEISTAKKQRSFVKEEFKPTSWQDIEPYYQQLLDTEIDDLAAFRKWLQQRSELESIISEDAAWRYINMTRDTTSEEFQKAYTYFVTEIEPKIAPLNHRLNEKAMKSDLRNSFTEKAFDILFKNLEKDFGR